jgi:hypothetical protein
MTDRKTVDWELVEKLYRSGILSLRQIGEECGCTEGAIRKRAKRDKWTRNLQARIQQRAEELVRKELVRGPSTQLTPATENETVEATAIAVANVLIAQKTDISRTRQLFKSLLSEIEGLTSHGDLAEQLMELLVDEKGDKPSKAEEERVRKMRETLDKILSMSGRVDSAKKLTDMLEKLVAMERVAYGIDDRRGAGGQVGDIVMNF